MDNGYSDVLVQDIWDTIPEEVRDELLARRAGLADPKAFGRQDPDRRWTPLRPVILEERAYRLLELIVGRLLELAVDSCRRRASTLGELHRALRFRDDLPLMDRDAPLVTAELTRCARPDILIERGRPRIVEFNVGARLGGATLAPRMAQGFARLVPRAGLYPPQSTVAARSEAMVRMLGDEIGHDQPRRLAIPAYWTIDDTGERRHNKKVKSSILADVQRVGFEVVRTDLDDLRLDDQDRLLAADRPIDLVLIPWASGETADMVDQERGLTALRGADRAGTVKLFPRTESTLINSKAVLGWLHEDCDAGLLADVDQVLVRDHIPRTVTLGLTGPSAAPGTPAPHERNVERDDMVVKPALGKAGNGVLFGSRTSEQDWRSAAVDAPHDAPAILQQRVTPDRIDMSFLDRESSEQVTEPVPFLLSPFLIDGKAADVSVRHMTPDAPDHDVVIAVDRGGCWNTVVFSDWN
jgi:hypothetical protein